MKRKDTCDHPWYHTKASITGLVCAACGTAWPDTAATIVWIRALEAVNHLGVQIEQLQGALFTHLDMTSCDRCGEFFPDKPLAIHGIRTRHFSLCRDCLLPGYYQLAGDDVDEGSELLDAIARWYYRHRDNIPSPFPSRDVELLVGARLAVLAQTDGIHTELPARPEVHDE